MVDQIIAVSIDPYQTDEKMPSFRASDFQDKISEIAQYTIVLKTLSCLFSWGPYLPLSDATVKQLKSSRSVIKLSSSTFHIPKFISKTIDYSKDVNEFRGCFKRRNEKSKRKKGLADALSKIFFSTLEITNQTVKVICSLHKTSLIDLTTLHEGIFDGIDYFSSSVNLITSVHRFSKVAQSYEKLKKATDLQSEVECLENEKRKRQLQWKMIISSFKIFTSILGGVCMFYPGAVPYGFTLSLSTISLTNKLGSNFFSEKGGNSKGEQSHANQPIYYLNA